MNSPRGIGRLGRSALAFLFGLLLLTAAPAAAGTVAYQLFFVPPTPLPPNVSETDGDVLFAVQLQNDCGAFTPVTWDVSVVPGGAMPADATDFGPPSVPTLMFGPGRLTQTFTIPIIDDGVAEGPETFDIKLTPGVGGVDLDCGNPLFPPTSLFYGLTVTIDASPAAPMIDVSIDDVVVEEGDAGTTDAVFTVSLSRAAGQDGTVTVSYATMDGTATAADDDYQPASGQLVFASGETAQTVTIAVVGDTRVEPDEVFFVDLSAPDGAVIVAGRGRGGIRDDDQEPAVLSISDVALDEGDGPSNAVFTVELSRAGAMTVTVDYQTADGTAIAGQDYLPRAGTLSFAPGQTSTSFNVMVIGDTEAEPDEVFFVDLSSPRGAVIGDGRGRALIRDDDEEASLVRFVRDRQTVMEGVGAAEIAVERVGGSRGPAAVIVTTVSGTARAGEDFQTRREQLRWRSGELGRKLLTVPIVDDNLQEDDEALGLRLSEVAGAQLGEPRQQILGIIDDDTPIRLEAVGDQEVTARVREDFALQVRASRMDGSPVAGATVVWRVEGRAELVGPEERQSDEEGVSTASIRAARMPGPAAVVARLQGTDSAVAFAVMVEGDLSDMGAGTGGDDDDIAQVLDQRCATATGELLELCDFLFGIDDDDERRRALQALTPRHAVAQGNAALRAPRVQLRNIGARLGALRGGSSRLATADLLSISLRGDALAVGTLRTALSGPHARADDFSSALDDALRGGPRDAAADQPMPDTESPWGFFVNGRLSFGDAPQTELETGYDFETQGITAGVDYRASDRLVLGLGVGYLATDLEIAGDGGDLEVSGYSVTFYSTWYTRRFYLDGVVAYGWNDYQLQRFINLPRQFRGRSRLVARGEPEGNQLSLDFGVGYDFSLGRSSLSGFLRASLIDAEVDAFSETGAGPFDLVFSSQQIESLQSEAGLELSRPVSLRWGVVQPSLRLSYLHEFEDDLRLIRARFRSDLVGRRFAVLTDTPDRDFFNLGLGITVTLPRSMATYLIFDTDLEREDLDIYTLSGGFRVQF